MAFVGSDGNGATRPNNFSKWQGNLLVGALAGSMVVRISLDGDKVVSQERMFVRELGRIRDVRSGPDGNVYVLTDAPNGELIRLEPQNSVSSMTIRIQVWDLPIRLFHWLLVLAVIGLFVTGKLGGNWMEWHKRLGYFVLGLVIFRILWGVFGSFHARFVNFVRSPMTVWNYMKALGRKESLHYLGHNPMGAFSVIAMLAIFGFSSCFRAVCGR